MYVDYEEMFGGKTSLNACLNATDALLAFENKEADKLNQKYGNYTVQQHGNRQQRRKYDKNNRNKNRGNGTYYNGNR